MAAWRAHSFGPASEQPYRRRTSDWFRLVIGVGILAFAIWHEDDPTQFEKNLFTTLNGLPSQLDSLFRLLYALGALWALGLVVVAALVARRWRLARDLAIGGVVTWALARIIGSLVVENASLLHCARRRDPRRRRRARLPRGARGDHRRRHLGGVAVPHPPGAAPRPVARARSWRSPSLYLGTTLPDGALAAVALGWSVAALVHLVFGSPGGRPTTAQVHADPASSSASTPTTCTCCPMQPSTGTAMSAQRRRRRPARPGARARRSRRATDVEVLAFARVQGRRPDAAQHPPRGRRSPGLRAPARRTRRRARAARRRRRHRGPGHGPDRVAPARPGTPLADVDRRVGHRRACSPTSGSRSRRCTRPASRTDA